MRLVASLGVCCSACVTHTTGMQLRCIWPKYGWSNPNVFTVCMKAAQITTIVTTLYGFNQCVVKQLQFDVLVTTDTKHMHSASHTEDVGNNLLQTNKSASSPLLSLPITLLSCPFYTVKLPNKGHFGNWSFVLCSEVVPISEVQLYNPQIMF